MELSITNVINISVSQAGSGASAFNTSNSACFTDETPGDDFGELGYKIYTSPSDVATDFGTSSKTYKAALKVFSQAPNILANGGYFVVIPFIGATAQVIAHQLISFTSVPTTGTYKLKHGADETTDLPAGSNAATVQTALRLLTGFGSLTVTGDETAGFAVVFTGTSGPVTLLTVVDDSLQDTDGTNVFVSSATTQVGVAAASTETLAEAITRTKDLVQYFAIGTTSILDEAPLLAAAAVIQSLFKVGVFVGNDAADVATGGKLDLLRQNSYTHSRGLFYNDSDDQAALDFQWAYIGRGFSVIFTGSNTTITMHMKDLVGVVADPNITQTQLNLAIAAGADCFVSIQGLKQPKVFCSGLNSFFDQIYNLLWFVNALQIAGANVLATSSSKVPQTEDGIDLLKNAYGSVCDQAVVNKYIAPGTWNSPDTFGDQAAFLRNITQLGYYIYSAPIGLQSATDREDRKAPLIQIAIKEAGAVHSSTVLVYVNK